MGHGKDVTEYEKNEILKKKAKGKSANKVAKKLGRHM